MEVIIVVTAKDRLAQNGHYGAVVWLTGLSGSGKTTIARGLERGLFDRRWQVIVLDGDDLRRGLSSDLNFSPAARAEQMRRVGEMARLLARSGFVVITALISPNRDDRNRVRASMATQPEPVLFLEVYVETPLEECERRDPKQLYAKAHAGEIEAFTGISAPYEPPDRPDLILRTTELGITGCVNMLLERSVAALSAPVVLHA